MPVTPPKFSVPVRSIPKDFNSSYSPKGTCQIFFPLFKLIAVIVPQGGSEIGYLFSTKALLKVL